MALKILREPLNTGNVYLKNFLIFDGFFFVVEILKFYFLNVIVKSKNHKIFMIFVVYDHVRLHLWKAIN